MDDISVQSAALLESKGTSMDFAGHLDPEIATTLADLDGFDLGSMTLDEITQMRAQLPTSVPEDHALPVRDIVLDRADGSGSLSMRVMSPPGHEIQPRSCLFWIHGGGYLFGSVAMPEPRLDHWVELLDCVVVAVEYRLAPEDPYPAALDDCHQAFLWTLENASTLGIDRERFAIIGESAGGGLAAALTLLLRDRGEPLPCLQLLVYPMIDDRGATTSSRFVDAPVWSAKANRLGWSAYLGDDLAPGDADVPIYAAPARATSLRNLPPTFICVGELDIMRDEGIEFARRLLEAEVPAELHVYPGAPHGFLPLVGEAAVSRRALLTIDAALERALAQGVTARR
jgi:acetyl esterase/lipase